MFTRSSSPRVRGWRTSRLSLLVVLALSIPLGSALADESFVNLALDKISLRESIELDRLTIGTLDTTPLPLTGQLLHRAKVVDTSTGQVYGIDFDGTGNVVDARALRAAETAAHDAQYGTLDPRLFDKLALLGDDETIAVGIWLVTDELQLPDRSALANLPPIEPTSANPPRTVNGIETTPDATDEEPSVAAERRERIEAAKALRREAAHLLELQMVPVQAGLLEELDALNLTPDYVSPVAPLVYVTAPKWVVVHLAERDDVDTIYGPNRNRDYNDIAKPAQKADIMDLWNFEGSGIDVAICEDSRIEFSNPNLISGPTRVPGDSNVDDHATSTAGMVASQHSTHPGMAESASLHSANGTTYGSANMAAALDWAASTQNVDVINNSWGDSSSTALNDHDRHCDYIVRNLWSTITVAAGNDGGGCEGATDNVGSPGKGFNVITVGGFDDQGTVTWDDDTVYTCSSWQDPSTGVEKPEVVASGANITSTTASSPWNGWVGSGTSYAAPMVAAEAANLMTSGGSFSIFPEKTKAAIMATALHNIEGASRLSEIDGAGGIDMRAAGHLGAEGVTDWRSVTSASFPYTITKQCFAGERVRAAISWDSDPTSDYSSDPLNGDFDLRVEDPSGTYVAGSFSGINPYEIVDFVAPVSGVYTFEVQLWNMGSSSEYIGFAAWSGGWLLTADAAQYHSVPDDVEDYYRFTPQPFWNVVAMEPFGTSDFDFIHNANSPWEDPADYDPSLGPFVGGTGLELFLTDRNHVTAGDQFIEVRPWSGTDDYLIEHGTHNVDLLNGEYGPYTLAPLELVEIFDTSIPASTTRHIRVVPSSGDVDLALFLYDSDPSDDTTHNQFRYDHVAFANNEGPGLEESLSHTSDEFDWHGFVVGSLNAETATTATSFMVYSDTTAPTGTVTINDGVSQTGAFRVEISVVVDDSETGIRRFRYRESTQPWSAWVDAGGMTVGSGLFRVDLPASGLRNVQVEAENMAGMTSIVSDTIDFYGCPQPASSSLVNGDFSDQTGFPWCFFDNSDDGFVYYPGFEAVVYGSNDGSGSGNTYISQQVALGNSGTYEVAFGWAYGSSNVAGFDGAFWDLINVATGTSVLGGQQTLGTTSGDSGFVSQDFTGPGTFELRLGTFSTDSVAGAGFTSFGAVEINFDPCEPVTGLTCSSQSGGVQLNWTNGETYAGHNVYRDGTLIAALGSGSSTSYFDSAASAGVHTYAVEAVCGVGDTATLVSCSVNHQCQPVTSLSCNDSGGDASLSWTNGESYDAVIVRRNGVNVATLPGSATSYTDTSAPSGTQTYEVFGQCAGLLTAATSCSVSLSCLNVTSFDCFESGSNVVLSWNNNADYSQIAITRNGVAVATLPGSNTSFTDTSAPVGSLTYQLQAVCASGGALAPVGCSLNVDCEAPFGLACSPTSGNVMLTWSNGDSYTNISVRRDGATIATLGGGATNFVDAAPPAGPHSYEVIGTCAAGITGSATCSVDLTCEPVAMLTCTEVSGSVQLDWINAAGYAAIEIHRNGSLIDTLSGMVTGYLDTSAPAGTSNYAVIAVCSGGSEATAATCSIGLCNSISGVSCTATGSDVQVNWVNGASYAAINIYRDGLLIATLGGSATTYFDLGVAPGSYTFSVEGDCGTAVATPIPCSVTVGATGTFVRGDCNTDGTLQISDVVYGLAFLFSGGPASTCEDACDGNDDGAVQISDMVYLLAGLFSGGAPPPPPTGVCGIDPTADGLGCASNPGCP